MVGLQDSIDAFLSSHESQNFIRPMIGEMII